MTSTLRFSLPYVTPVSGTGAPYPGGQLFFYLSGTSTPANTYADSALSTPNTNPLVANGAGLFGAIFLDPTLTYKVVLEDANNVQIWTADPVAGPTLISVVANLTIESGGLFVPSAAGAVDVGSSGLPFGTLFADILNLGRPNDGTVAKLSANAATPTQDLLQLLFTNPAAAGVNLIQASVNGVNVAKLKADGTWIVTRLSTPGVLFANLPASPAAGDRAFITNCSTTTFNAAADGAGAANVPVWYSGSSWRVG